jgi:hypothetical protein
MKTALNKEVYLKVLADRGRQGITPRELYDRSDLLQAENGVKRSIPKKTMSMALIRLESHKLAFGMPEGKTRRYWIDPVSGQKFLDSRRKMRMMREARNVYLRFCIQMNKNKIAEVKQIEGLIKFAEERWPDNYGLLYFVRNQMIETVDPISRMLDSINLNDQENAELMIREITNILDSYLLLRKALCIAFLLCMIREWTAR